VVHRRAAPPALILLALLFGCRPASGPDVVVHGAPTVSGTALAQAAGALVGAPVTVSAMAERAWATCTPPGGGTALKAEDGPRFDRPTVVLTASALAVDQPGAPCTRVFGAAPPGTNAVLISDREVRGRCSSMPHADAIAAVIAHELGHARGIPPPGDGTTCTGRGCHCDDASCLMNDGHGGCPQPGEQLCARCRGATPRDTR